MSWDVHVKITFTVATEETHIGGNLKTEHVEGFLAGYIQAVMGSGTDDTPRVDRETYTITLALDLSDDIYGSNHDCGNKGLRDGIVMRVLALVSEKSPKVTFKD